MPRKFFFIKREASPEPIGKECKIYMEIIHQSSDLPSSDLGERMLWLLLGIPLS